MGCVHVSSFAIPIEELSETESVNLEPHSRANSMESSPQTAPGADAPSIAAALATAVDMKSKATEHGQAEEHLEALPLITLNGNVYHIGAEAAAVLKSLKQQQIAVVSVAGDLRQGKSYILNRLAQAVGGFKVAPTTNPCTHSIWMWPKPVMLEGQQHQVVFLDTEGMASQERTQEESNKIVSLAGLLSSLLIHNKLGTFDENCVNRLAQVALVMRRLYSQNAGAVEMCLPPKLLVLLRDHNLDFGGQTQSEFLEGVLMDCEYGPDNIVEVGQKNQMRQFIRNNFPHRSCHTLPIPSAETHILQQLSNIPDSRLNPAFVQGVRDLTEAVYSQATPKLVQGKPMTGPIMLQLLEAAVNAVNSGQIVNLPTVWGAMVASELQAARSVAHEVYTNAVDGFKSCYTEVVAEEVHKAALGSSEAHFRAAIQFAEPDAITAALLEHTDQCNTAFSGAVERIRRIQAEDDLSCAKLLQAAREAAQEAFYAAEFTNKALQCCGEEAIVALFEEHVEQALEVFNTAVEDALPAADKADTAKAEVEAAIAKARSELMAYAHRVLDLVEEKVYARAKAQEAEALEAEKCKLELRMQQEQELYARKQALLVDYKATMQEKQASFASVLEVEQEHKALLQELMPYLPNDLEAGVLSDLKQGLQKECEEVLALTKQLVHDRITHADQATLAAAAQDALALFQSLLERIPAGSCDVAYVEGVCQGAADTAKGRFETGASKQSTFPPTSPGYVSVHQGLCSDIDRLQKVMVTNVQVAKENSERLQAALEQGKEAAEAVKKELQAEMERLQATAAEERARAAAAVERERVRHEKEMEELRKKQLVVVRQQEDVQRQRQEALFAAMQSQMMQLTSNISARGSSYGCQPCINSSVRVVGGCTVEEPDEYRPSRCRARAEASERAQCTGTTLKGFRCRNMAQPGRSTCHHH